MRLLILFIALASAAFAHIGSPDVFFEDHAGPYPLAVTIRPPSVIPGVAEIEIRAASPDVQTIHITPVPLSGVAAKYPPTPDVMKRSPADPQFFTGALWIMRQGAWQVRVDVDGKQGRGRLGVPLPAVASRTLGMQRALGIGLFAMMLLLSLGVVSIIGASIRESQLPPGELPAPRNRRRAAVAMAVASLAVVAILWSANRWWTAEANGYQQGLYKPLTMTPVIDADDRLTLTLTDPGWARTRRTDDFLPDHGHLMHLYVVSVPAMDRVWHLHPEQADANVFTQSLPAMPAGVYRLYADVVHQTGFPETLVATLRTFSIKGHPLTGDDAAGSGPPIDAPGDRAESTLPDGYRMIWERPATPLKARQLTTFRFRLLDPQGRDANDVELYMGMQGHAAFLKTDGTTFAHIHPTGSVAMPMIALANGAEPMDHAMMHHGIPAEVTFPYGLPAPGAYRAIVQIKRGGVVETGMFNLRAE